MGVISLDLQQTDAGYDVEKEIKRLDQEIDDEVAARVAADTSIWEEIETIEAASDVVDVVGTHAALESYDTSKLQDNDIIKVLQDETRDDAITYYRWNETDSTFVYVGAEGPYYTASETDTLLAAKQDTLIAGDNITIAADGKTISATDTTYTHFTGATASEDGAQGLVPAPVAGDEDKVLKGDGTWGDAGSTYSAGTGIDITNDVISVDTTVVATQTDLAGKQDTLTAGTNVQINNNVISATDTTYSNFVGTDGTDPGVAGLVPAPAVTDTDKYLKSDGTWAAIQSGGTTTMFYSQDNVLYKDSARTVAATGREVVDACDTGDVVIEMSQYDNSAMKMLHVVSHTDGGNWAAIVAVSYYRNMDGGPMTIDWHYTNANSTTAAYHRYTQLQKALTAGSNITISGSTISARDTTYSTFGGATSQVAGTSGLVPAPAIGDDTKFLAGDGSWTVGYERVELFLASPFGLTTTTFEIYKDSLRQNPITWSEFRDLLTESNKKEVVFKVNNSSDTMYPLLEYWDDTTEFAIFEVDVNATFYITNNTDDSGQTEFKVDRIIELQEKLTAGTNITIAADGKTISATDTTYTAGSNISISAQNVISATVPATNNISSTDWNTLWQ